MYIHSMNTTAETCSAMNSLVFSRKVAARITPIQSDEPFDEAIGIFAEIEDTDGCMMLDVACFV